MWCIYQSEDSWYGHFVPSIVWLLIKFDVVGWLVLVIGLDSTLLYIYKSNHGSFLRSLRQKMMKIKPVSAFASLNFAQISIQFCWYALWLGGLFYTGKNIVSSAIRYSSYTPKIQEKQGDVDMTFPNVTVCSNSMHSNSKMAEHYPFMIRARQEVHFWEKNSRKFSEYSQNGLI